MKRCSRWDLGTLTQVIPGNDLHKQFWSFYAYSDEVLTLMNACLVSLFSWHVSCLALNSLK